MQQRFILNISEEGTLILAPVTPVEDSQGIVLITIIGSVFIYQEYLEVGTNSQNFLFSFFILLT